MRSVTMIVFVRVMHVCAVRCGEACDVSRNKHHRGDQSDGGAWCHVRMVRNNETQQHFAHAQCNAGTSDGGDAIAIQASRCTGRDEQGNREHCSNGGEAHHHADGQENEHGKVESLYADAHLGGVIAIECGKRQVGELVPNGTNTCDGEGKCHPHVGVVHGE